MELHDALYDVKRSKTMCKHSGEDIKKIVQDKFIDGDYRRVLKYILSNAEMHEEQNLSNRKRNAKGSRRSRNTPDKEALVPTVYGHSDQKPCPINNTLVLENQVKHLSAEPGRGKGRLIRYNQHEHVDQVRSVKKYKGKNMVKGDYMQPMVHIKEENNSDQEPRNYSKLVYQVERRDDRELMKVVRGDYGFPSQKPDFGNHAAKNVKAAKRSVVYQKNINKGILGRKGNDGIVPDVEILDSAVYLKKGSSFVSAKKFDGNHPGGSSACREFRKQVLDVLRKPFDKEEYDRRQKAVRAGSYLHHYPDLESKLKKYRYKCGKRLTILRGFFFWLQNVTQEGSFQPWKDRECLAVELEFPKNIVGVRGSRKKVRRG